MFPTSSNIYLIIPGLVRSYYWSDAEGTETSTGFNRGIDRPTALKSPVNNHLELKHLRSGSCQVEDGKKMMWPA